VSRRLERRIERRSITLIGRALAAGTLGSATMGLLLVLDTVENRATPTVTALTGVLYVAWILTPEPRDGGP